MRISRAELRALGIKRRDAGRYRGLSDLHLHSIFSGNALCHPKQLVKAGHFLGLDAISITDHNTTVGNRLARDFAEAKKLQVQVVPGMELMSWQDLIPADFINRQVERVYLETDPPTTQNRAFRRFDVLGYWINLDHPDISALEKRFLALKKARITHALEATNQFLAGKNRLKTKLRLKDLGSPNLVPPTRAHLRKLIEKRQYGALIGNEEFSIIMRDAYRSVGDLRPSIQETVDLTHAAGGLAFLAHPLVARRVSVFLGLEHLGGKEKWQAISQQFMQKTMFFGAYLEIVLDQFKAMGGDGVEALHSNHLLLPGAKKMITDMARERGLFISGGSDFHAPQGQGYYPITYPWYIGISPLSRIDEEEATFKTSEAEPWLK